MSFMVVKGAGSRLRHALRVGQRCVAGGVLVCPRQTRLKLSAAPATGGRLSVSFAWPWVAQRNSLDLNLVAAVDDAIEDRVGERGVVEVGVPCLDGQLECGEHSYADSRSREPAVLSIWTDLYAESPAPCNGARLQRGIGTQSASL